MNARLFTIASRLSLLLLLCVIAVILWASISPNTGQPFLRLSPGSPHYALGRAQGGLALYRISPPQPPRLPPNPVSPTLGATPRFVPVGTAAQLLLIPRWALLATLLILPILWLLLTLSASRTNATPPTNPLP